MMSCVVRMMMAMRGNEIMRIRVMRSVMRSVMMRKMIMMV